MLSLPTALIAVLIEPLMNSLGSPTSVVTAFSTMMI
jgi:hypothetical protein